MKLHGPDEPVYTISVVARLLGVSTQALRLFEREGLIEPARTEANIRLYSQNELLILRRVCELVREDGVNLAGVRTVLRIERRYQAILSPVSQDGPPEHMPDRAPDQSGSEARRPRQPVGDREDDEAVTGGERRGAGPGGSGRGPRGY